MKKVIWLFGENESKTMNNNSYYFWKKVCSIEDNIDKYYVVEKNKKNKLLVKSLPNNLQKMIIWKNSIKNWILYFNSSLNFVSLSYKDTMPCKLLFKKIGMKAKKSIIYLQHGTIAIKKLGYQGSGYNNNFLRFFIYNKNIIEDIKKINNFRDYQLYYAKFHPRYGELIRRNDMFKDKNQILYFLTWREYLGDNKETKKLINELVKIVKDDKLNKYLRDNKLMMKICLHQFFDRDRIKDVYKYLDKEVFEIVTPKKIDVMDELAKSMLLITDYSSVGFDFTFLNKPVIMYTPDLINYSKGRDFYCSTDELKKYSILKSSDLIKRIISGNYEINEFFKSKLPKKIDYNYIANDNHIIDMYNYIKEKEDNKISFIGYRFGGSGGTVSATKAMASCLLNKGYMVELVSLNGTPKGRTEFPYGAEDVPLSCKSNNIIIRSYLKVLRLFSFFKFPYDSLKYDTASKYMIITIKRRLKKYLNNTNSKVIISTRESFHPLIYDTLKNDLNKDVIYFFHTDADSFKLLYSGLENRIKNYKFDKCAFVTESNYQKYSDRFKKMISDYRIMGNTVDSKMIENINNIKAPGKKNIYHGICLTRLSNDRLNDVNNIIEFGKILKDRKINNIKIDVYGKGNISDYLEEQIKKYKISKYIRYMGLTKTPEIEIKNHDFLIDFSVNQSFGMIYLEGILGGKITFASLNTGSKDVLKEMDYFIYKDYDDLIDKLANIKNITTADLKKNYKIIYEKYGPEVMTNKLTQYFDENKINKDINR